MYRGTTPSPTYMLLEISMDTVRRMLVEICFVIRLPIYSYSTLIARCISNKLHQFGTIVSRLNSVNLYIEISIEINLYASLLAVSGKN